MLWCSRKLVYFGCILLVTRLSFTLDVTDEFTAFVRKYHKPYANDTVEYNRRLVIFKENVQLQEKLNAQRTDDDSAWYGVNKFSDLTPQEFSELYLSSYKPAGNISTPTPSLQSSSDTSVCANIEPVHKDWRDKDIVTAVKNQKSCGACWAFSSVETIESMYALTTGKLQSLSVQEVIDCSLGYKNLQGCGGGDTCMALKWMKEKSVKLVKESAYPTTDKQDRCRVDVEAASGVAIANYSCYTFVSQENQLLKNLASHGPVVVSVDAALWHNYQGGIIQYHCGTSNNHAVEIIGYDCSGDIPYYIIKNSWGSDFGHEGYLYVKIGNNVCGIAQEVGIVDVKT